MQALRDVKNAAIVVPHIMIDRYTTMLSKELMKTEDFREATAALPGKKNPSFEKR
jgi:hypothetical protein